MNQENQDTQDNQQQRLVEDRLGLRARLGQNERALLVELQTRRHRQDEQEETLRELQTLCRTAGVEVVHTVIQRRSYASAATFVHKGKAQEIKAIVQASGVDVVIFNDELTPAQGRNLEEILQVKIVDRPQLIMDIFAQRAMTTDAKLQVELAQLDYLMPRLRGWGTSLSRLGGGIGTRGPGETKLDMERHQLRTHIHRIKKLLKEAKIKRAVMRKQRQKQEIAQVVLVGYTNTGKSTLLNRLTEAQVLTEDKLFATLNPVARRLQLPDQSDVILSDTVGFIRKLPKQLVPAFQSTLESVAEADLLLHVIDASDVQWQYKWESVQDILNGVLGLDAWPPVLHVLNKMDAVSTPETKACVAQVHAQLSQVVEISALEGHGVEAMLQTIVTLLDQGKRQVTFFIPYAQAQWLDRLHRHGEVQQQRYEGEHMVVDVILPQVELDKIEAQATKDGLSWQLQPAA